MSGAGGSHWGRGVQSIPVQQGWRQRGEKAPGKARGEPGVLAMTQPTCVWAPPHPAANQGCRGLELPARSCLTALAKPGRAEPLAPSTPPDPASCPSLGAVRIKEEESAAQRCYPNRITVL